MNLFRSIPLMGVILAIYNVVSMGATDPAASIWNKSLITFGMPSGIALKITFGSALILFALFILFIELFKATTASSTAMIEQTLSIIVFVVFLVQLLISSRAANPTFLILSGISLVEALAGFVVMMKVAKRDVSIGGLG